MLCHGRRPEDRGIAPCRDQRPTVGTRLVGSRDYQITQTNDSFKGHDYTIYSVIPAVSDRGNRCSWQPVIVTISDRGNQWSGQPGIVTRQEGRRVLSFLDVLSTSRQRGRAHGVKSPKPKGSFKSHQYTITHLLLTSCLLPLLCLH